MHIVGGVSNRLKLRVPPKELNDQFPFKTLEGPRNLRKEEKSQRGNHVNGGDYRA